MNGEDRDQDWSCNKYPCSAWYHWVHILFAYLFNTGTHEIIVEGRGFNSTLGWQGLLLRLYTQNIDTLEREAGIPDAKLVEAHGTFHTSHCLDCHEPHTFEWMKGRWLVLNRTTSSITSCELASVSNIPCPCVTTNNYSRNEKKQFPSRFFRAANRFVTCVCHRQCQRQLSRRVCQEL